MTSNKSGMSEGEKIWASIDLLAESIRRRPEVGDKFVDAFRTHVMGPNPRTERDYLNNYAGFWNAVYETNAAIFPTETKEIIRKDYETPNGTHGTGLGMVLSRLENNSFHPGLKDLLEDVMRVYHGVGIKKKSSN